MSTTYVLFGCFYLVILLLFSELITIFFTIFLFLKGEVIGLKLFIMANTQR
jgi:hypothetical protein